MRMEACCGSRRRSIRVGGIDGGCQEIGEGAATVKKEAQHFFNSKVQNRIVQVEKLSLVLSIN
jgi:hypothetical protein